MVFSHCILWLRIGQSFWGLAVSFKLPPLVFHCEKSLRWIKVTHLVTQTSNYTPIWKCPTETKARNSRKSVKSARKYPQKQKLNNHSNEKGINEHKNCLISTELQKQTKEKEKKKTGDSFPLVGFIRTIGTYCKPQLIRHASPPKKRN